MSNLIIVHEAEIELWEASKYYEAQQTNLGQEFLAAIESATKLIVSAPLRWALREDNTRRYLLTKFPYLIVYTIENDQIWIVAFAHCKRAEGYWENRLNSYY